MAKDATIRKRESDAARRARGFKGRTFWYPEAYDAHLRAYVEKLNEHWESLPEDSRLAVLATIHAQNR